MWKLPLAVEPMNVACRVPPAPRWGRVGRIAPPDQTVHSTQRLCDILFFAAGLQSTVVAVTLCRPGIKTNWRRQVSSLQGYYNIDNTFKIIHSSCGRCKDERIHPMVHSFGTLPDGRMPLPASRQPYPGPARGWAKLACAEAGA